MYFLVPFVAAKAVAATLTIGEAIGIGATVFGVGAFLKGTSDYSKAKKLKAEAEAEYQEMASHIRRRAAKLKKSSKHLAA